MASLSFRSTISDSLWHWPFGKGHPAGHQSIWSCVCGWPSSLLRTGCRRFCRTWSIRLAGAVTWARRGLEESSRGRGEACLDGIWGSHIPVWTDCMLSCCHTLLENTHHTKQRLWDNEVLLLKDLGILNVWDTFCVVVFRETTQNPCKIKLGAVNYICYHRPSEDCWCWVSHYLFKSTQLRKGIAVVCKLLSNTKTANTLSLSKCTFTLYRCLKESFPQTYLV